MRRLRLGTRASKLALTQAEIVIGLLKSTPSMPSVELVQVSTLGDRVSPERLAELRGKGAFVGDLETMLQNGEIDAAVHSMKDLPMKLGKGLSISSTPAREDRRDVLVSAGGKSLQDLPEGARVGTSSLRRSAQIRRQARRVEVVDMSGNVDTRLSKVAGGRYDAIVLAAAGIIRLGQAVRITQYFSVEEVMPAPCQGAIAVEVRKDDMETDNLFKKIDNRRVRAETAAERAFATELGSDCDVPAGASAASAGGSLVVSGLILSPDGGRTVKSTLTGTPGAAAELGRTLANDLLSRGGQEILREVMAA